MQRSAPLSRVQPAGAPWKRARTALDHLGQRLADPVTRRALLWHAFWAPFWTWSDSPKPGLPARTPPYRETLVLPGNCRRRPRPRAPSSLGHAGRGRGLPWHLARTGFRCGADAARRPGRTDVRSATSRGSRRHPTVGRSGSGCVEQAVSPAHGTNARSHLRASGAAEHRTRRPRPRCSRAQRGRTRSSCAVLSRS